uniref:Uncharacterized protein n=1 Tax=Yersinia enterocolitica TaxID=630 RepID=B0RKS4_YEREN|nr:hypothetical protein [Yersinia enterocolitica]
MCPIDSRKRKSVRIVAPDTPKYSVRSPTLTLPLTPTRFAISMRRSIALFISSPLNAVKTFHHFSFSFIVYNMNLNQCFKNHHRY